MIFLFGPSNGKALAPPLLQTFDIYRRRFLYIVPIPFHIWYLYEKIFIYSPNPITRLIFIGEDCFGGDPKIVGYKFLTQDLINLMRS